MGADSKIEWTDHTFNPWIGCQKVSAACDHCYAETLMDHRYHKVTWGPHGDRVRTSPANWKKPLQWARAANGLRPRVFCASLADWLDNKAPQSWREDLAALIEATPQLDWLLLTKRIENFDKLAPWHHDDVPANVWLGVTCESQDTANRRVPILLSIGARVRFLSCEPLLGPVDLTRVPFLDGDHRHKRDALTGHAYMYAEGIDGHPDLTVRIDKPLPDHVDWVICGGESGAGARDMSPQWARQLRDQCAAADVAFFMKQMTKKAEVPLDLQVRQFPEAA